MDKTAFNTRIPVELLAAIRSAAEASGAKIEVLATRFLEDGLRRSPLVSRVARDGIRQALAVTLAETVARDVRVYLERNGSWFDDLVNSLEFRYEGALIFRDRMKHFYAEKSWLAKQICPLIIGRILHQLKMGRNVVLVVDSGTTLFWLFGEIGAQLTQIVAQEPSLSKLAIWTNNIAGIDYYMALANVQSAVHLSDRVACHSLGGLALPRYAALVGDGAVHSMEFLRNQKQWKNAYRIGLVVGSWVTVDNDGLTLLTKEDDQVKVKEAMLDCDETLCLTPLGKVFIGHSLKRIGDALKSYQRVTIPCARKGQVILVTTSRFGSSQILVDHGYHVSKKIGGEVWPPLPPGQKSDRVHFDVTKLFSVPASDLPHIALPFHLESTREQQVEIEFPHHSGHQHKILRKKEFSCAD